MATTVLPNGLVIEDHHLVETRFLYEEIFESRNYLRRGITLPPGAMVLDVGANIGLFSLFVARERPDARTLAFEPAPDLFTLLERNLSWYRGVRVFPVGVASRNEDRIFTYYPRASGMSSFHGNVAQEREVLAALIRSEASRAAPQDAVALLDNLDELLEVRLGRMELMRPVVTLHKVLREQAIERVDLLKIDAQKCELEALEGLAVEDWPKIQQIVMEVHDIDGRVPVLETLLRERGFEVAIERPKLTAGTALRMLYARRGSLAT